MSRSATARAGTSRTPRRLRLERICVPLASVAAALVVAGPAARVWVYLRRRSDPTSSDLLIQLFDLNTENNVPTWFSSMLLLLAAVSAAVVALVRRRHLLDAGMRRWGLLAAGLALLSLDEAASLHERLLTAVGVGWVGDGAVGLLRHAWVVPGALAAVVLLLGRRRLALDLPRRPRGWFLLGAGLYFFGAVVIESVSGLVLDQWGDRAGYISVTAVEEGTEMAGTLLLLFTMLNLLDLRSGEDGALVLSLAQPN